MMLEQQAIAKGCGYDIMYFVKSKLEPYWISMQPLGFSMAKHSPSTLWATNPPLTIYIYHLSGYKKVTLEIPEFNCLV